MSKRGKLMMIMLDTR